MAKWYGQIGYFSIVKTAPGVYSPGEVIEKDFYGDMINLTQRMSQNSDSPNDEITLSCEISIYADPFVKSIIPDMRYVTVLGNKWKIERIVPDYPRIKLTLGGLYHD